jgi:hypothetical protein
MFSKVKVDKPEFDSWYVQGIFYSSERLYWLWDPRTLLFSGYWGSFLEVMQQCHYVSTHSHLVLSLRMTGAIVLIFLYVFNVWTGRTLPFLVVETASMYCGHLTVNVICQSE